MFNSLFENFTPFTVITLKGHIENVINNYEPRARNITVQIKERLDNNAFDVYIYFYVVNIQEPAVVKVQLERVR